MNNKRLPSSVLTKVAAPQEAGGILGFSSAVESSTRIIAPILGGILLQRIGAWAPGAFGAVIMAGISIFVFITTHNHHTMLQLSAKETRPTLVLE